MIEHGTAHDLLSLEPLEGVWFTKQLVLLMIISLATERRGLRRHLNQPRVCKLQLDGQNGSTTEPRLGGVRQQRAALTWELCFLWKLWSVREYDGFESIKTICLSQLGAAGGGPLGMQLQPAAARPPHLVLVPAVTESCMLHYR